MQTVTDAYLLGIKEGRALLNAFPDVTPQEMRRHAQNCSELVKRHSGVMRDTFRGERDFWNNQIKKG